MTLYKLKHITKENEDIKNLIVSEGKKDKVRVVDVREEMTNIINYIIYSGFKTIRIINWKKQNVR